MKHPIGDRAEPAERARLTARLRAALDRGELADDARFAAVFAAVLRYQRRFSRLRPPSSAPLPVELFKYRPVVTFSSRPAAVFLSSGTQRGAARCSRHALAAVELYEAALQRGFAQAVFDLPDLGPAWTRAAPHWNLLVPAPAAWWRDRHSSLAHMGRTLWASLREHADAQLHRIDPAAPTAELRRTVRALAATAPSRVTLGFGTGFGFLQLVDRLAAHRLRLPLHPASQVLETGGYKGRGRELAPARLHAVLAAAFGLADQQIFAEYGMTELSSQAYQVFDRHDAPRPDLPVYRPAESLRVRALDAAGRPCPPGTPGLLEVRDALNLTSAAWLVLGDIGWVLPAADDHPLHLPAPCARRDFQVLGRAEPLAARGCGLAADLKFHPPATAPARTPPSSGRPRRSVPKPV